MSTSPTPSLISATSWLNLTGFSPPWASVLSTLSRRDCKSNMSLNSVLQSQNILGCSLVWPNTEELISRPFLDENATWQLFALLVLFKLDYGDIRNGRKISSSVYVILECSYCRLKHETSLARSQSECFDIYLSEAHHDICDGGGDACQVARYVGLVGFQGSQASSNLLQTLRNRLGIVVH